MPPVLSVDMTRPGVDSPRSHSIQASSSLTGSGAGLSMAPILRPERSNRARKPLAQSERRGRNAHASPRTRCREAS